MDNKCKWFDICPMRTFEKVKKISLKWRNKYCLSDFLHCQRYIETSKGISHPANMLPDGTIDANLQ